MTTEAMDPSAFSVLNCGSDIFLQDAIVPKPPN